nr:hypothetical protein [Tanacetum cinerariifolium]
MTPSTIATITTSGEAPIPPPIIPSIILENLPTFNSAFRFEERLRSLETSFSEYRQTNQFADVVSAIPGIVHQYMDQQIKEAVQIQTDRLQDSVQRENDEFLRNINENMKKVLKGLVKNQVDVVSAIPGIIHQYMDQQMKETVREAVQIQTDRLQDSLQRENDEFLRNIERKYEESTQGASQKPADLSEMELKKILIEKMEGNKFIQ